FAEYLRPFEKTDIVIVVIEALRDSSIFGTGAARNILDLFMRYPDFWLEDVPKIMSCIQENMACINMEPAKQSVEALLLVLTEQYPTKVVMSLLKISPTGDSAGMAIWKVMLSIPQALEKILKELLSRLQAVKSNSLVPLDTEEACITHLALMASIEFQAEEFGDAYQRHASLVLVCLLLRRLITLSERRATARKMQVLLPHIVEFLEDGHTDIKMNVLVIFRNMMSHLEREEASPIAVQLVEEVLPLFEAESSRLRELSISLFRDLVETLVKKDKRMMKKKVQRGLLPLFFHTHDGTESVAKASGEALLAAAELLKWKELKHLVQPQQTWSTAERLLMQDRRRAEEYMTQSLPYLKNAQPTLRVAAIRFIGLGARLLRDQNEKKLQDICSALKPLLNDAEPSVESLAAQTLLILETPRRQPTSGWSLRTLCC
ncbi:Maestro heat-like repeat-containing protein family member 7, partial [Charadrius vociferus]